MLQPNKGIVAQSFDQHFRACHVCLKGVPQRHLNLSSGVLVHGPVDMARESVVPGGSNSRLSASQG